MDETARFILRSGEEVARSTRVGPGSVCGVPRRITTIRRLSPSRYFVHHIVHSLSQDTVFDLDEAVRLIGLSSFQEKRSPILHAMAKDLYSVYHHALLRRHNLSRPFVHQIVHIRCQLQTVVLHTETVVVWAEARSVSLQSVLPKLATAADHQLR